MTGNDLLNDIRFCDSTDSRIVETALNPFAYSAQSGVRDSNINR